MSPGWQSNSLQIASRVLKRIPLTLPVLSSERFVTEMPILSDNSVNFLFLLTNIRSSFTSIAMPQIYR